MALLVQKELAAMAYLLRLRRDYVLDSRRCIGASDSKPTRSLEAGAS